MTATRNCPACGSPLPADAPAGLCPRCLLAGGFDTAASPPSADFEPPTVAELGALFPQLEIIELLGAGGMGAVYKARQPILDRFVALKVLPPNDDASFAERFIREARALAKLNHPGIVHVYDFGQAGGHSYIVMEFVEGVNLRQAVRAGRMTPAEALAVVPQICSALQFAHEAGIVHRDIKPENILLDQKGRVKIADFGLAKLLGVAGPHHLTGTHQAMGTLHYMAPEQWEKPATVDHRADIYSLGVVFYELLTGELPLGRFAPPSEKVQIDVRLDQVVLRALEKEPERRYQHASDVKTDLERITTIPTPQAPPDTASPHQRWRTNDVIALWVIIMSVVIWPVGLVALPVLGLVSYKRKRSMVRVVDDALHFLGLHRAATWTLIVCVAGVANAFLPWAAVTSRNTTVFFFGFDARFANYPLAVTSGFLALGIFFFVISQLPGLRLWRACIALAGGATLIVLTAVFLHETYAIRYWNVNLAEAVGPKVTRDFNLVVGPGPFVAAALAIALMGLGALDLRRYLVNRPFTAGAAPDDTATTPPVPPTEPPPLPVPQVVSGRRPRFLFHVGLPVFALVALWMASYLVIGSDVLRYARDDAIAAKRKLDGAFFVGPAAQFVLIGVAYVGPIVSVILFLRWLWITQRSRRPARFRVVATVLILLTVLGYGAIGFLAVMRMRAESRREMLIGTWDGTNDSFVFHANGTCEFGTRDPRVHDIRSRRLGEYRWLNAEWVEVSIPTEPIWRCKVSFGRQGKKSPDILELVGENGLSRTYNRFK